MKSEWAEGSSSNNNSSHLTNPIDNMQANNLKIIAIWTAWFLIGKLIIILFL